MASEEYLERERAAPTKSEYYLGEMFAMARANEAHVLIVGNLYFSLARQPSRAGLPRVFDRSAFAGQRQGDLGGSAQRYFDGFIAKR